MELYVYRREGKQHKRELFFRIEKKLAGKEIKSYFVACKNERLRS